MMNHVILIGRLTETPTLKEASDGKQMLSINLAVPRTFRNQDGIYETDFIRCILWNGVAEKAEKYCKKGDMVSVRGRLQVRSYEDENKKKEYITEVIVETLTFVSSVKIDKDESD